MKKYLLLLLLSLFVFTSCGDDDELDPVQWKSDLVFNEMLEAHVDAKGGTYLFTCTNYKWVTLNSLQEDYGYNTLGSYYPADLATNIVTGEWSKGEVKGVTMTITISKNESGKDRYLTVTTESGDAFGVFHIIQSK
jgi:hypothetical protein